eukprot:8478192-Ditylum_brightwellii.AAC.1
MGDWAKDNHKAEWKDSVFEKYDKINVAGAWSAPFLCTDLPADTLVLPPKLAFKMNIEPDPRDCQKWPQHPILWHKAKELCMQCLASMQDNKDASHK